MIGLNRKQLTETANSLAMQSLSGVRPAKRMGIELIPCVDKIYDGFTKLKWDAKAMSQSFLLSNMAPQVGPGFNGGIWRVLEGKVRKWVVERGELYVVTGPIYVSDVPKTIGPNKVSVPSHFYKVIFDPVRIEAIAFVLPNKKLKSKDLPTFII